MYIMALWVVCVPREKKRKNALLLCVCVTILNGNGMNGWWVEAWRVGKRFVAAEMMMMMIRRGEK